MSMTTGVEHPETWLNIEKESTKKISEFMKTLFEADIPGSWYWFDKLDCSVSFARQLDKQMTYKKFIRNIRKNRFVRFAINRKEHPPDDLFKNVNVICLYIAFVRLPGSKHVERMAWHCTPIDSIYFREHPNYKKIDEIFKKTFKTDMKSYETL